MLTRPRGARRSIRLLTRARPPVSQKAEPRDHTAHRHGFPARPGQPADRRRARRPRGAGDRGGRAARRRRHRAVRRPVPQGSDRHARRRAAAHAGGAAALPARAGGAPRRDPRVDPRAGQARRRARGADPGRRLEGPAGGHLPAVQAEAADQGADRPGGRAGAAGRRAAGRPDRRPAGHRGAVRRRRDGRGRRRRRAGRRPRDPGRAVRRGRRPDRRAARADVVPRAGWCPGSATARRRPGRSSPTTSSSPSRSPSCRRTGSWRCSGARRRRSSTSTSTPEPDAPAAGDGPAPYERRASPPGSASPTGAARPTAGWPTPCAGPGAPGSCVHLGIDLRMRLRQRPRTRRSGCSPPTCATCCSPRRPAPAPTMGLDPGFRTGVKVAVVDATGKVVATETIYPHEPRRQLGRVAGHAGPAGRDARRRADRDRQRHRLAGDRQARRRPDQGPSRARADQGRGVRGRRVGLLRLGLRLRGSCPSWTCRCAARCRSPAGCRTRWPSWSRSTRSRSASGSTSTTSPSGKLSRSLDAVVEDCVNAVGVDVNTASAPLLTRVSGHRRRARREHRGAPRRERPVPHPASAEGRAAARAEGVRAVRRLPAHPRRRRPARRLRRAPRGLPGGAAGSSTATGTDAARV